MPQKSDFRLYRHYALTVGQPNAGDHDAAKLFPPTVGHEYIWLELNRNQCAPDVQRLRELIRPGGRFFLCMKKRTLEQDDQENARLYKRLGGDTKEKIEALCDYLYYLRCNVFHGSKILEECQLEILRPSIRCLETIIEAGLKKLDDF